jgi:predicted nucleic acid-binding protein
MATSEHPSPVVLDTSVLSNFARTDDLDLLGEISARFVTVEAVIGELQRGVEIHGYEFLRRAIAPIDVIDVETEPGDDLAGLIQGETFAIHAAREHSGTVVLDDGLARDRAREPGVALTGSVGLVIRLVRQGTISEDEADAMHERWVKEGQFRSHVESITEALERVN